MSIPIRLLCFSKEIASTVRLSERSITKSMQVNILILTYFESIILTSRNLCSYIMVFSFLFHVNEVEHSRKLEHSFSMVLKKKIRITLPLTVKDTCSPAIRKLGSNGERLTLNNHTYENIVRHSMKREKHMELCNFLNQRHLRFEGQENFKKVIFKLRLKR